LLHGDQVVGDRVFCSKSSDQFLYENGQGSVVLSSISDASQQNVLGRYLFMYGFSPKETTVLLGDAAPQLPSPRIVYAIGSNGIRSQISQDSVDTTQPAYDPRETTLAFVEGSADPSDIYNIDTHFQIVLYQKQLGLGILKKDLSTFEPGYTNQSPSWSADGRYLAYEHASTDESNGPTRPRDAQGNFLDGDIMLDSFDPNKQFLLDVPAPQKLGISGSNVQWLP